MCLLRWTITQREWEPRAACADVSEPVWAAAAGGDMHATLPTHHTTLHYTLHTHTHKMAAGHATPMIDQN